MYVKSHTTKDGKILLAVCDSDLLGKVFEEGKLILDLSGEFYKGEILTKNEVADLMRNADLVNLVGEKTIAVAIEEEILEASDVKMIDGIPLYQSLTTI